MTHKGFTLIELLIVFTLSCIFLQLTAVYQKNIKRTQIQIALVEMKMIFEQAKQTALLNQSAVIVCPSQNGMKCSNNWTSKYYLIQTADKILLRKFIVNNSFYWQTSAKQFILRPTQVFASTNNSLYLKDKKNHTLGTIRISKMARIRLEPGCH